MSHIEQAVFTSAETDRSLGYQVVGRSPGLREEDAQALAIWGPSHDSLLDLSPEAESYNFHPLPSGAFCVSRTTPAGWEYSGRGGHRVYTQCLIVQPELLARFANNPFALLRAALASGMLEVHEHVPSRLDPLQLSGRASPVDQSLLARLAANPGSQRMANLVQAALDLMQTDAGTARLAVAGSPSAAQLLAGLFNCLPVESRTAFSFCTGLKYSSRRPFRIQALSDDPAERRWVAHQPNVTMVELYHDSPIEPLPWEGWAQLINRVLASGRTTFLATQLSKRRFDLTPDDLAALGLQLLEDFEASALRHDHGDSDLTETTSDEVTSAESDLDRPFVDPVDMLADPTDLNTQPESLDTTNDTARPGGASPDYQQAHAAHQQFAKSTSSAIPSSGTGSSAKASSRVVAPSKNLGTASPQVLEKLELLDDLVYEALSGQTTALNRLEVLWPEIRSKLDDELLAESREQYLQYALSIWENCVNDSGVRAPARAVQALDVLCVLFDEV